jgi:hypothetical protein
MPQRRNVKSVLRKIQPHLPEGRIRENSSNKITFSRRMTWISSVDRTRRAFQDARAAWRRHRSK